MAQAQTIGVIGLGYVGLPVAVAFANIYNVIGIDTNAEKIKTLAAHIDPTGEISPHTLQKASIHFSTDAQQLQTCDFIIVAVPTPITSSYEPDVSYLVEASTMIGTHLRPETVIIYESTVYPGTTENVCIPLLETSSSLTAGVDFFVGYSPERINPGDHEHNFQHNTKVVSGQNEEALEKITQLYESVLEANVHKAPSIKVAEAAKIVENTQRDINIAFMNELSIIFNHLQINTQDVLEAAKTKWNFSPYKPGLVGGHCISVDPHYLMYASSQAGFDPPFTRLARLINDSIPHYIVQELLRLLVAQSFQLNDLRVIVLGVTFKENIADIRNSKTIEIVKQLENLHIDVQICDPYVDHEELRKQTTAPFQTLETLKKADVVIVSVPHTSFASQPTTFFTNLLKENRGIIMDIKGILPRDHLPPTVTYWTL